MDLKTLNFERLKNKEEVKYRKSYLNIDLLEQFTIEMGKIKVLRNSKGYISATATLNQLKGTLQYNIIKALYEIPVGDFYKGSNKTQKEYPILGRLTPIPMWGLKRDKGIKYEEWDKQDAQIVAFLGKALSPIIEYIPSIDYKLTDIRTYYTNNNQTALDAWPKKIKYLELTKIPAIILGQLWLAYVDLRCESMILDLDNWDNMPEAHDALGAVEHKIEWDEYTSPTKPDYTEFKKKVDDAPWD